MSQASKIFLLVILCVSTLSIAQAQREGRNRSPEQLAERQTTLMTDSLSLSDAQKEKIAAVNLLYAEKMSDARTKARESADGDRSAIRTAMQALRTEQNDELKKYLTTEQFEKWKKIEAERRRNRRGKGRRGGRKGGKQNNQSN